MNARHRLQRRRRRGDHRVAGCGPRIIAAVSKITRACWNASGEWRRISASPHSQQGLEVVQQDGAIQRDGVGDVGGVAARAVADDARWASDVDRARARPQVRRRRSRDRGGRSVMRHERDDASWFAAALRNSRTPDNASRCRPARADRTRARTT